jgi:hypothetical protein
MDNQTRIQWLKIILLIIGVIAFGLLCINQFFGWLYKIQLISSPCQLCEQLNNVVCNPKITLIENNELEKIYNFSFIP